MPALVQDMGVDYGCRGILMLKQRLNGSDVSSFFKKMGGKSVKKRMGTYFLGICSLLTTILIASFTALGSI